MNLREDARVIVAVVAGEEEALLEVTDEGIAKVYGAEDWRDDAPPSYGWDEGGDLRQQDGQRFYGSVIRVLDVPTEQAAEKLKSMWENVDGVFV